MQNSSEFYFATELVLDNPFLLLMQTLEWVFSALLNTHLRCFFEINQGLPEI